MIATLPLDSLRATTSPASKGVTDHWEEPDRSQTRVGRADWQFCRYLLPLGAGVGTGVLTGLLGGDYMSSLITGTLMARVAKWLGGPTDATEVTVEPGRNEYEDTEGSDGASGTKRSVKRGASENGEAEEDEYDTSVKTATEVPSQTLRREKQEPKVM